MNMTENSEEHKHLGESRLTVRDEHASRDRAAEGDGALVGRGRS